MRHEIDNLDKKILKLISQNARIPFLEVARECNVSGAAIHQRVQKLSNIGVIKGSEFIVNTYKVGFQTCAYIGICVSDLNKLEGIVNSLKEIPEIVECHYTTGKYAIFVKVYARDNRHLLDITLNKISSIPGIVSAETFLMSLDEVFHRQLAAFDITEDDDNHDSNE
jgi:Lrp/AsnC family transcriptional regulator for asnA, asnC and gidA